MKASRLYLCFLFYFYVLCFCFLHVYRVECANHIASFDLQVMQELPKAIQRTSLLLSVLAVEEQQ